MSAIADPMDVLAGRSPGARRAGALTQTKPARLAANERDPASPFTPSERVLSGGRERPSAPATFGGVPGGPVDGSPGPATDFAGGVPDGSSGGFSPIFSGGAGGIVPGGGGGGVLIPGGGGGTVPPTDGGGTVIPPTGSVPEPSGWAMLIGGFLAIGVALRRRKPRAHGAAGHGRAQG